MLRRLTGGRIHVGTRTEGIRILAVRGLLGQCLHRAGEALAAALADLGKKSGGE